MGSMQKFPFFALLWALLPASALAYIPPSEFIARTMVQKRAPMKSARLRGRVMGFNSAGGPSGVQFISETHYDAASGVLRCTALDEQGRELFRMERYARKESEAQDPAQLITQVLLETRAPQLVTELKRWSLPVVTEEELLKLADEAERRSVEKTFFARQKLPTGLQVAWVIGEKNGNQLWIEKDTFLPVKLLFTPASGDSERLEVGFEGFRTIREVPFPKFISLQEGGRPVLREELQEVSVNPASDQHDSRKQAAFGFTEAGNAASSELRELIRRFYKTVR